MVFEKQETAYKQRIAGNNTVIFTLAEETRNKLQLLAQRRQISQAAMCRYALTKFLEEEENEKRAEVQNQDRAA